MSLPLTPTAEVSKLCGLLWPSIRMGMWNGVTEKGEEVVVRWNGRVSV